MVRDPSTALGMTERRRDPAIRFSAHESLRPSREYGLKIRALFFPRDHANIDVLEAGVFQKLVQLHFAETEPVISVKFELARRNGSTNRESQCAHSFSEWNS